MFAVIKSGGRQYKVSVGQRLEVNRLPVEVGKQVQFDEVLLISDASNTMVGAPLVENALVLATAIEHGRGEKLIVFKYKAKKRYRHRRGHRQELTIFTIDDIVASGKSLVTGEAPAFQQEEEESAIDIASEPAVETFAGSEAEAGTDAATSEETEAEVENKPTRRRRVRKAEETEGEGEE